VKISIVLGVSSCLLGEKVRYDGGHKLDLFIAGILGRYVRYVPVCPEMECGFGAPREPLCLLGRPDSPRLVTVHTRQDHTGRMLEWARKRVIELEGEGLSGFIFKSGSPSSGMERVKVYNEKGVAVEEGVGVFARAFIEHFPQLPVEDEERLQNIEIRRSFLERIFDGQALPRSLCAARNLRDCQD